MSHSIHKISVLNIPVSPSGMGDVKALFAQKDIKKSQIITFVNPYACYLENHHSDYTVLLESFDIVACDGIGMVVAARACGLKTLNRESFDFTSIAHDVFQWIVDHEKSVGFIGGENGVAEKAAAELCQRYPQLKVTACFSGYGSDLDNARKFFVKDETDFVICGMGAPIQERFLVQLVSDDWFGTGLTCGGFLDQVIEGEVYYPAWINRLNLRFLYRLLKEPRRLWRRYLVDYQIFLGRYIRLQWKIFRSRLGFGRSPGKNE